jgi:hypothetical protein
MKHPIITLAFIQTISQFSRSRATHSLHHAGYSRTLYTSIAPEQSNIILKNEVEKEPRRLAKNHPASRVELISRLQDWP